MLESQVNRDYVRTDNWSVTAKLSKEADASEWFDIKVTNMAAGGLLFLTDMTFETGDTIWIDMKIDPLAPGIFGTIPLKVTGVIRGSRGTIEGKQAYAVEFTEISKSDRIRLDELVRMTNYKFKLETESDLFDR
jgi:hypothetical protein